jgi:hypothetical protein
MQEKTYKRVTSYGLLRTIEGGAYLLLSPQPLERDSWLLEHQQAWLVVHLPDPFDFSESITIIGEATITQTFFRCRLFPTVV